MPSFDAVFEDEVDFDESLTQECTNFLPIFGSIEGADRYMSEAIYGQPWEVLSRDTKLKALMTATRSINCLRFTGARTSESQPLMWPRNGDTETPQAVQQATYEEALALANGADPNTEFDSTFVSSRVFGKVRTDYAFRTSPEHVVAGIASLKAWTLLRPFLNPARTVRLRRES